MKYKKLVGILLGFFSTTSFATANTLISDTPISLQKLPGFFRFSYESLSMPEHLQRMGLLGLTYSADITDHFYLGVGGFGAMSGTEGGLFVLGANAGYRHSIYHHLLGNIDFFVGGGGGKSALVGGGLMLRPSIGLMYDWQWIRLGVQYSYINFPTGKIRSSQVSINVDLPTDFYYLPSQNVWAALPKLSDIKLPDGKFLTFQKNDFGILLQAYRQDSNTINTNSEKQNGTIKLVGAELNHYFTDHTFWWIKASGAFSGIPNGYMDVLGGIGYHWSLGNYVALVPQLGVGAGGGGMVDSGGGLLLSPTLGVEVPLSSSVAFRLSSGYLWAPKGSFHVVPATAELLYHLNFASGNSSFVKPLNEQYEIQGWRIQLFNQTYFHVQRNIHSTTSPIEMIGVQFDQLFSPHFFLSYQGAAAYSGFHAGGYATGMIGPGIQSSEYFNQHLQWFGEFLIGAGGGGGVALSGGAIVEPVIGFRYAFTRALGLQASYSQIKSLQNRLNTPALNIGLTLRFDALNGV